MANVETINWNYDNNTYSSNTAFPVYVPMSPVAAVVEAPTEQTPLEWLRNEVEEICALAREL